MPKEFDGRHVNPIANSNAKCLIENWFEERAVESLDNDRRTSEEEPVNLTRLISEHKGILSTNFNKKFDDLTVNINSYRPTCFYDKTPNTKADMLAKQFHEQAVRELEARKVEEKSKESVVVNEMPVRVNCCCPVAEIYRPDYINEQPITFWSQHSKIIPSVSDVRKTFETPFRKNASFSTPIEYSMEPNNHKPYEHDHVPNL
ncbi:hypothetical protein HELRODRAFT_174878 [Helobdella robusta]|uniref:Uncharacterized protein n=1 Tax=Helobdella robusta TaxID=6412 RepID=T1F8K4_HELRO|nr:hypothetical protein HELRODRAFT_174878 [Helobdella robusta]ESO01325.1 hypothetical protein HELRODRAFT_174878 [Helobdella robusta]